MKLGICANLLQELRDGTLDGTLSTIGETGYTYVETVVCAFQDSSGDEIEAIRQALDRHNLGCTHANVLFPGTIKVVGEEANAGMIKEYLEDVLPKMAGVGVHTIVFGSGGARRIPEGFSRETAVQQFRDCARTVCDIAGRHGIRIALEHLNPGETNFITTIQEAVELLKVINHPNCGLLFDFYHVDLSTDDLGFVRLAKDALFHVHLARQGDRQYPTPADSQALSPFFELLREVGYDGTLSLEARLDESLSYEENLKLAYQVVAGR